MQRYWKRTIFNTRTGFSHRLSAAKNFLTEEREKQIISLCEEMSSLRKIEARKLAQIAGIIISQIAALGPIARIRTRAMYHCLKTRLLPSEH